MESVVDVPEAWTHYAVGMSKKADEAVDGFHPL